MTSMYHRRQLLVGGAALALAGTAFAAQPRRTLVNFSRVALDSLVPTAVGPWTGVDDSDVVPEQVDASIDHGQTLARRYLGDGVEPVMLVVSYHGPQSPDLKVHRPETCYTVAGFEGGQPRLTRVTVTPSFQVPSVSFTAKREQRTETVLYWTRVGDRFPQTLSAQRLDFLGEAMRGVRADGLLMRASTVGSDPLTSEAVLRRFSERLVASSSSDGRKLLLGPAGGVIRQVQA